MLKRSVRNLETTVDRLPYRQPFPQHIKILLLLRPHGLEQNFRVSSVTSSMTTFPARPISCLRSIPNSVSLSMIQQVSESVRDTGRNFGPGT